MPRSRTNYIVEARWNDPKKVQYRTDAVIAPYQQFFAQSIPEDKQYWTLCGAHYNEQGPFTTGSEFLQATENIIAPHQFHGIDREAVIIDTNRKIHPEAHWHCDDLLEVVKKAILQGSFNPAIFHFDGVNETEFTAEYVARLFRIIDDFVPDPMLLVTTLLMKNPYRASVVKHGDEFIGELLKYYEPCKHWRLLNTYYWYTGTGVRSNTIMGSFAWIKQQHDATNIQRGAFQFTVSQKEITDFLV